MIPSTAGIQSSKTNQIYGFIRDGAYSNAITVLNNELVSHPSSRAALSLLGYCNFQIGDFVTASQHYSNLCSICPDVHEYRFSHAHSLYKAGLYDDCIQSCTLLSQLLISSPNPTYSNRLLQLQSQLYFDKKELNECSNYLSQLQTDSIYVQTGSSAVFFAQQKYTNALNLLKQAQQMHGVSPDILYAQAVCYYALKDYSNSMQKVSQVIELGVRSHPELSVGSGEGGKSVGNSLILKQTCLVEAFNLKMAIEYQLKNNEAAAESLNDLPPRLESELDPITLHNQALLTLNTDPTSSLKRLSFLLTLPPSAYPVEAFSNLLLAYIKHEYYGLAADVLAEHGHLHHTLEKGVYEYLEAVIQSQSAPAEAYRKLDQLANLHIEKLRKLTKQIQDARLTREPNSMKETLGLYDAALEQYIPCLMSQCKIYWEQQPHPHYAQVELLLKQSAEFASEHDCWRLNVAHVFFMQDKYKDAIRYYEPLVKRHYSDILQVPAAVLANLCVSYIMTSQNEEAEELMRLIERKEDEQAELDPDVHQFHLCIVNLVIGTLYCSKGNYEFGLSRVFKSLEPMHNKLGLDTWHYTKRCFLSVVEMASKAMHTLKEETWNEAMEVLQECEKEGKNVVSRLAAVQGVEVDPNIHNVAMEARAIKRLMFKVRE